MGSNPDRSGRLSFSDLAYVQQWAENLVVAIGKAKARLILAEYQRLARNPKATAKDRATAGLRAKILKKHVN